jgi:hypothetical protein
MKSASISLESGTEKQLRDAYATECLNRNIRFSARGYSLKRQVYDVSQTEISPSGRRQIEQLNLRLEKFRGPQVGGSGFDVLNVHRFGLLLVQRCARDPLRRGFIGQAAYTTFKG